MLVEVHAVGRVVLVRAEELQHVEYDKADRGLRLMYKNGAVLQVAHVPEEEWLKVGPVLVNGPGVLVPVDSLGPGV